MIRLLLPALALAAAIWASRVVNPSELGARYERMETWIRRWGPLAAALLTVIAVWWTWGFLEPIPVHHDESSFLLQADIFAHGRWTAPTPAIPEFFEQPQVLVVPAVASRFPPGHALLLSIGALLHFPPLMPLVIAGLTAALLVAVVSLAANPWVAVVAWLAWLTTPLVLRYQASYFAATTSTLMVLAGWWCLLEWRVTRKRWWAAGMAAAFAWAAITQPIVALAFALPAAVIVAIDAARGGYWLATVIVIGTAALVLAIVPLWSERTTGDAALTPTELYRRDYFPFDRPGFTLGGGPPRRELTPVLETMRARLLAQHEAQQPHRIGRTIYDRLVAIAGDLWQGAQLALLPFFVIGLLGMTPPLRVGLVSAGLLILARIPYAQDPGWTLTYLPIAPVIAAITAWGVWRTLVWAASGVIVRLHVERRPKLGSALIALVLAFFAVPSLSIWRLRHQQASSVRSAFDDAMLQLPSSKSIIFLRYAPQRAQHLDLVFNYVDLQREPVWVVHDLGERDHELTALAQDRTPYVFDEQTMEFRRF